MTLNGQVKAVAHALNANEFRGFVVVDTVMISPNTARLTFALPEGATELGLPTASCVVARFSSATPKEDGSPNVVIRPYTPIEDPALGMTGTFELVVKKYPNSLMGTHIHGLKKGDILELKGPIAKFVYAMNQFEHVGMIAGGTGITPMMQVIHRILSNPEDKTKITLMFANVTEADILLRTDLDKLIAAHPGRLTIHHTLSKPADGWTFDRGHVNRDRIAEAMPAPGKGKVFFCGPPGMMEFVAGPKGPNFTQGEVGGLLKELGYTSDDVYKF